MQIMYSEFRESLVMTVSECAKYWSEPLIASFIGVIVFAIALIFLVFKYCSLRDFIKQNNLQEKYRNWKELNRGL